MRKRMLAVFLASVMALGLFGCSSNSADNKGGDVESRSERVAQ